MCKNTVCVGDFMHSFSFHTRKGFSVRVKLNWNDLLRFNPVPTSIYVKIWFHSRDNQNTPFQWVLHFEYFTGWTKEKLDIFALPWIWSDICSGFRSNTNRFPLEMPLIPDYNELFFIFGKVNIFIPPERYVSIRHLGKLQLQLWKTKKKLKKWFSIYSFHN